MKITQKTIFFIIIIVLVLGAIGTFIVRSSTPTVSVNYDEFATCIKDKGVKFYGAFWCAHCNSTKKFFGSSKSLLPYVECSTPGGDDQTQICKDKKIEGYPTWEFADGTRLTGEISMSSFPKSSASIENLYKISEKTSCQLPPNAPQLIPVK